MVPSKGLALAPIQFQAEVLASQDENSRLATIAVPLEHPWGKIICPTAVFRRHQV
jgi:hypothetical protein